LQPEVREHRARLISHDVILNDNDAFGSVTFGSLSLHGRYLPASQWKGRSPPCFNTYDELTISHFFENHIQAPGSLDQLIYYFDLPTEDTMLENSLADMIIFQISSWKWGSRNVRVITLALLLVPVKEKLTDTYQRVGIAEVPNTDGLAREGWGVKDICII